MAEITKTEHIKACPLCGGTNIVKDYKREEKYCAKCGLIISSAITYVGLEKVDFAVPHSAPSEARNGIHTLWTRKDTKGKNPHKITNYKHNLTNKQLMKYGKK